MPVEIQVLALAGLLQVAQFALMAIPVNLQVGVDYTGGPRDTPIQITGIAGRLKRAMDNHFEGLIMFTIAVVAVTLGGKASGITAYCAWIYLGARVLYVPAYLRLRNTAASLANLDRGFRGDCGDAGCRCSVEIAA